MAAQRFDQFADLGRTQVDRLKFLSPRPGLPCALAGRAFVELLVAQRRECLTLLAATIREPLGNLEQRTEEQIGRFKIEASERDQTAEVAR